MSLPAKAVSFTNDELVLVMISLVRATHPSMLRKEGDGFTVDFEILDRKKVLDDAERLLFKVRAVLDSPSDEQARTLQLNPQESQGIADALAKLQRLQTWPADVLEMCKNLHARLTVPT